MKMKTKKILITAFVCLALVCCGILAACGGPTYYKLTFETPRGVTVVSEVESGAQVKEGYNVEFSLELADDVVGTPVVQANGASLTADPDGVYSFEMKADTRVTVTGVSASNTARVIFSRFTGTGSNRVENRVTFTCENGDASDENGFFVEVGTEINFTLKISVYQTGDYDVLANTTIIEPDENGVYTYVVRKNTTFSVTNLETDMDFVARNAGSGTLTDPFRIERPIDLYAMAYYVNGNLYEGSGYNTAYYRLMNDIDLEGEQMYIIGDNSTAGVSVFCGSFDGNGHTISDFHIEDHSINQESFATQYHPYVGMFGFASATTERAADIYNLHLDNFTVTANATAYENIDPNDNDMFAVGGLVGLGLGVTITGCTLTNGTILADAATNYAGGYIGGAVGLQQSLYDSASNVRYYSLIRSTYSDVDVIGASGYINAAGGLVGWLYSDNEQTTAFVLNSYSTGDVSGAARTGGVVGNASFATAIVGCYATGNVTARCTLMTSPEVEAWAYAYAGGLVGYADYNSILSDSFADANVRASAFSGESFQKTGALYGATNAARTPYVDSDPVTVNNSYSAKEKTIDETFLKETLHWSEADWTFGEGYPTINHEDSEKTITVTLNFGTEKVNGEGTLSVTAENAYLAMSHWYVLYVQGLDGIPQFVETDDGLRSYGYFFDEELRHKVPYGYVPIADTVLYAGFADYNDVAGEYFIRTGEVGTEVSVTLGVNGELIYRNGAFHHASYYVYDGESILLVSSCLPILSGSAEVEYVSFAAEAENGVLTAYDMQYFPQGETTCLKAYKPNENFRYGEYYSEAGATYTFYKDGRGRSSADGSTFTFTVSPDGSSLSIEVRGGTREATVAGDVVRIANTDYTAVDDFDGTWQKSATFNREYTFRKGEWTYTYFGYDDSGERQVISTESGSYQKEGDGVIRLKENVTAFFDGDGFLVINDNGTQSRYFRENSFVGQWRFQNRQEPVELTLDGIGRDGFGHATANFLADSVSFDLTYETVARSGEVYLAFYADDVEFGLLHFAADDKTLGGGFYSARSGSIRNDTTFFLYDAFKGRWTSEIGGFDFIEFNGFGLYQADGTDSHMAVRGSVTIDDVAVGTYSLENGTMHGTFEYDGVTYEITFNEAEGVVEVKYTESDTQKEAVFDTLDEWAALELIDEAQNRYSFDGRGKTSSGGTMHVTTRTGSGNTDYTYKIEGNGLKLYLLHGAAGAELGSITVAAEGDLYQVSLNGSHTAHVRNGFTGSWIVGGRYGTVITIGEIGPSLTASGTIGESVTFTYHPETGTLTFSWNGVAMVAELNGQMMSVEPDGGNGESLSCIPLASADSLYGDYTSVDGSRLLSFDGLGRSRYSQGTAVLRHAQTGTTIASYTYTVSDSEILLVSATGVQALFVTCTADAEGAFTVKDGHYAIREVDVLFHMTAYLPAAEGDAPYAAQLYFDGLGGGTYTPYGQAAVAITYENASYDSREQQYLVTFTYNEKEYSATISYSSSAGRYEVKLSQ